jgi:hypothetical protein
MAPGARGNPRGRPVGATGRFSEARVNDFAREWREYGPEVNATVRQRDPVAFLQIATRLVPKFLVQMERPAPVGNLTEEELTASSRLCATYPKSAQLSACLVPRSESWGRRARR